MADLSITPADVTVDSSVPTKSGTSGAAIDAGDLIYSDSADSDKLKPADNSSAAKADVVGVALNSAPGTDQPVEYVDQPGALITITSGATVGEIYVVSANGGAWAPEGDLVSTNFVTVAAVATAATTLRLGINVSGVQVP